MNNPADTLAALADKADAAYRAFKGAFDTPAAWRKDGSDYADDARQRLRDFFAEFAALASLKGEAEPVAWCQLTPNGGIAYFDGKPMVMVGQVGNYLHPTPLYTAPPPQQADLIDRALAYLNPHLELGTFAAPDWAIQLASILTGGDGCGTPVPAHATPSPAPQGGGELRVRHIGGGLLALYRGDEQVREIGVTPGWDFRDRDEFIARYNAISPAQQLGEVGEGKMLAFVLDVMDYWPDSSPDGGDLQDLAIKHGLLVPTPAVVPCSEDCNCAEFYAEGETADCYHRAPWLAAAPGGEGEG